MTEDEEIEARGAMMYPALRAQEASRVKKITPTPEAIRAFLDSWYADGFWGELYSPTNVRHTEEGLAAAYEAQFGHDCATTELERLRRENQELKFKIREMEEGSEKEQWDREQFRQRMVEAEGALKEKEGKSPAG